MGSDILFKREELKRLYPYKKWITKVNAMSDNQIVALYLKYRREGKL